MTRLRPKRIVVAGSVLGTISIAIFICWSSLRTGRPALDALIEEARQRGFPVQYSDFLLTTTPEEDGRARAVTNAGAAWFPGPATAIHGWMSPVGPVVARCRWQTDPELKMLAADLDLLRLRLDRAVAVLLEDVPLRFTPAERSLPFPTHLDPPYGARRRWPAVESAELLMPHLADLNALEAALTVRMAVDLRDGRTIGAWTNLQALTALALGFQPEPTEGSHLARAALVRQAYGATWEALRTNVWSPEQLAQLVRRWKQPNFWTGIPEIPALSARVSRSFAANARLDYALRPPIQGQIAPLIQFAQSNPIQACSAFLSLVKGELHRRDYVQRSSYRDEMIMLTFAQERRDELRQAISAGNWLSMRILAGATNSQTVQLTANSPLQDLMNVRAIQAASARFRAGVPSVLAAAAEAEALRRVLITALAIERYRLKTGQWPKALSEVPEAMPDFITGEPLRYRGSDRGPILYSIGLNAVDDGGTMEALTDSGLSSTTRPDLVWPRQATPEEAGREGMPGFSGLGDPR